MESRVTEGLDRGVHCGIGPTPPFHHSVLPDCNGLFEAGDEVFALGEHAVAGVEESEKSDDETEALRSQQPQVNRGLGVVKVLAESCYTMLITYMGREIGPE